ncbi:adenylyltransferase/cytidyltransferase family protein [Lachnospiraceae bacterium OttesenSCG-928-E19]|nr:adenylyltransferase/cytidyltransferase family protein [Lachnospiraceae bacterium OttesenSCG-928-E19]
MAKYNNGLIIMRAQPFHLGHENMINHMLNECDKIYILIGSAQESGTTRNPFTYGQRKQMIENVYGVNDRITIKPIADLGDYTRWANYIVCNLGFTPDAYYCGDDQDKALFESIGINVVEFDRTELPISATEIRETKNMNLINPSNIELVMGGLK